MELHTLVPATTPSSHVKTSLFEMKTPSKLHLEILR
jgi:hypothetical protein